MEISERNGGVRAIVACLAWYAVFAAIVTVDVMTTSNASPVGCTYQPCFSDRETKVLAFGLVAVPALGCLLLSLAGAASAGRRVTRPFLAGTLAAWTGVLLLLGGFAIAALTR